MEGDWELIECFLYVYSMGYDGDRRLFNDHNVKFVGHKISYLPFPKMPPGKFDVIT